MRRNTNYCLNLSTVKSISELLSLQKFSFSFSSPFFQGNAEK